MTQPTPRDIPTVENGGPPGAGSAPSSVFGGGGGERAGDFIGPYRLMEVIGEGGFGVVWLAERREPMVQRVALKVIKAGMDSRQVIARFEQERQALAVMDHPGVAKVFDAGVTPAAMGARPYFVMEHVSGEAITGYCDRQRLTVRERLELFAAVCEAVQHAHHKGIIHRDLKPSNVLVSAPEAGGSEGVGAPKVKVIDFGVAKAISQTLTEKTVFTERGQIIGTPEYMSPEQAEMGATDIDTRTDVYSLGVMLYELLTGALPFDSETLRAAGYAEIQRIIREVEPPRPSTRLGSLTRAGAEKKGAGAADACGEVGAEATAISQRRQTDVPSLIRALRSELEWIPLKAMRKDRSQRYRTPIDLADDIRNYQAGRALRAGPESAGYRARKFVRRNRATIAAGGVVAAALVLGLAGTLWQAGEARRERDTAREAAKAEREAKLVAQDKTRLAEEQQRAAELEAYIANLSAADSALRAGDVASARARLEACPEELRGWEWRYLDAQRDGSLLVLRADAGRQRAAWSPDGTRIVTACKDNTARIWDSVSGRELAALQGHADGIEAVAFSPDGKHIATGSKDQTARIWDSATGAEVLVLLGHTKSPETVEFTRDGSRLLTTSGDGTARIWDSASGREIAATTVNVSSRRVAALSPDGGSVASSKGGVLRVVSTETGEESLSIKGRKPTERVVCWSPDGSRLLIALLSEALIVDAASGNRVAALRGHEVSIFDGVFTADGTRVVTCSSDRSVRIWDAGTGKCLHVLTGHGDSVEHVVLTTDSRLALTGSRDGTARVWDVETGQERAVLRGHEQALASVAFSPDGSRAATASFDGTVRVWDFEPAAPSMLGPESMATVQGGFSPDSSLACLPGDANSVRIFATADGREVGVLRGHAMPVMAAVFNADGSKLMTASMDGTVRAWDSATARQVAAHRDFAGPGSDGMFTGDGRFLVTATVDGGSVRICEAVTGETVQDLDITAKDMRFGAYSPQINRLVTGVGAEPLLLWDTVTGRTVVELADTAAFAHAAFSEDGSRLVTSAPGGAAVYHGETGEKIGELRAGVGARGIAFNPDGTRIAVGGADRTVRIWDADRMRELLVLRGEEDGITFAAFSPDGNCLLSVPPRGRAMIRDARPHRERRAESQQLRERQRQAEAVVRTAAGDPPDYKRSADAIRADKSLPEELRRAALRLNLERSSQLIEEVWPTVFQIVTWTMPMQVLTEDAVAGFERDRTLTPLMRELAIEYARGVGDSPGRLILWARLQLVSLTGPTVPSGVAERAHRAAVAAVAGTARESEIYRNCLTILGLAQMRTGRHEEAVATLREAAPRYKKDDNDGDRGLNAVCLALALAKLGRMEEARAALDEVRGDPVGRDQFTKWSLGPLVKEAEGLIEGKSAAPAAEEPGGR